MKCPNCGGALHGDGEFWRCAECGDFTADAQGGFRPASRSSARPERGTRQDDVGGDDPPESGSRSRRDDPAKTDDPDEGKREKDRPAGPERRGPRSLRLGPLEIEFGMPDDDEQDGAQ